MKGPSPLLGFNNNVKHKGRVFHIQTEDSGIHHPHVITHLFADGGRILKTKKTSYAEHVGDAGMTRTVRTMMQDQHKAMFIALRGGHFDHLLEGLERPLQDRSQQVDGAAPLDAAPPPSSKDAAGESLTASAVRAATASAATEPAMAASAQRPTATGAPSRPPQGNLELDLDALERAAQAGQSPVFQEIHGLPPPPAAVMGANRRAGTGTTSYRSVTPVSQTTMPAQSMPIPPLETPPTTARDGSRDSRPGARRTDRPHVRTPSTPAEAAPAPEAARKSEIPGRYAPSRPASIFGSSRPAEGASIFGEDLISEKSLDEVILGYLAEDLEGPAPKK